MNTKNKNALWVEKFRPQTVDQYIFHDPQQRAAVMRMINEKSIPHLLFSGVQGSGKTTLAQILVRAMGLDECDALTINASDENSVDTIRDKIKSFVTTVAMGPFKIVHLEEADYITPQGQGILRRMMEEYSDSARFILTCNYDYKIIPPIKSRCQQFHFKAADKNDIAEYVTQILSFEKIKFDLTVLDKYITYGYPDIRKIVNMVQQNSINGNLNQPHTEGTSGDWKFDLIDMVERDKWLDARKLVCANVIAEEWTDLYRFLYENLHRAPKFHDKDKWEEGILTIAKHLYQHSIVADPEICAAACFIELGKL